MGRYKLSRALASAISAVWLAAILLCSCESKNAKSSLPRAALDGNSAAEPIEAATGADPQRTAAPPVRAENGEFPDSAIKTQIAGAGIASNEVVALLNADSTEDDARKVASECGGALVVWIPEIHGAVIRFATGEGNRIVSDATLASESERRSIAALTPDAAPGLPEAINRVASADGVEAARPHYYGSLASVIPDDPEYGYQYDSYYLYLDPIETWAVSTGSSDVVIAIIDSGVDYGHPDFAGRIVTDPNPGDGIPEGGRDFMSPPAAGDGRATPGNGIDDDGDFLIDESERHGCRVAGVALATGGNAYGIAGMDWNARILSLRVTPANGDEGGPGSEIWESDTALAMAYTLRFPDVRVVNISIVFPRDAALLREATQACASFGKLLVAAAGNEGLDTPVKCAPAYFPEALAVAGTQAGWSIWSNGANEGSNYGTFVDVCAPAKLLYTINSNGADRRYTYASGTSLATGLVSGLAGLVFAAHPGYTAEDVRNVILGTATSIDSSNPGYEGKLGAGRINPPLAMQPAVSLPPVMEKARFNGKRKGGIHNGLWEIDLFFSRKLDAPAATDLSHYSITPNPGIVRAVLLDGGRCVRLLVGQIYMLVPYTVTISGLKAEDGELMQPYEQTIEISGTSSSFNALSKSSGAAAGASSEFSALFDAAKSIDDDQETYWYAEVPVSGSVELKVKIDGAETINSITLQQRPDIIGGFYGQVFDVYLAGVESDQFSGRTEYSRILIAQDLLAQNGQQVKIEFPSMQAIYVIFKFKAGDDVLHDSDSIPNGVSVSQVTATRELSQNDVYAPFIASMIPRYAPLGATVVFRGDSFGDGGADSGVYFETIKATVISWSTDEITALVPYNPLSLPVAIPPGVPDDASVNGEGGVTVPPTQNAILPAEKDAESGPVYVRRGAFISNQVQYIRTE
ncbi:MAG: S8 family serine peptidase [bacterium]